jgi:hypothetical protein
MGFQALKFHKNMESYKSVAYFGWNLHMKSYKYHLIMQEDKVMLCTYTGKSHEYGDDNYQYNSALHSIKEVPTSSYQAKY